MKTVFLMRHAKSSWDDPSLDDHERPLNPRGFRQAPQMAERLNAWLCQPQAIVSSTAQRAKDTAVLVAQTLADKPPIVLDRKLYSEQRAMIAHAIQALDADHDTVMIIGHNPALNDYLHDLGMTKDNLPTSGVAVIHYPVKHWIETSECDAQLCFLDWPKRLQI
ncbi:histidine phosphatase family protein [Salinivibrio sp. ES.052]|uniref:SixA phosphatase family protein n=1 Tax=Salinivibrio sp. ES.052 TaxID=1882823 RepID=UPI0009259565|nr:histidine phosphatase family protein [Salinivibrio sp. ES.052]SIO35740.1 phosphohistidine phosphatase [Salinivibrio sp. ES.052]